MVIGHDQPWGWDKNANKKDAITLKRGTSQAWWDIKEDRQGPHLVKVRVFKLALIGCWVGFYNVQTRGIGKGILEVLSRGNAEQKCDNEEVPRVIHFD